MLKYTYAINNMPSNFSSQISLIYLINEKSKANYYNILLLYAKGI